MSLMWRRKFDVMDGETLTGSFRLMVKSAATWLARKCGCCPCVDDGYYIAALCACEVCGGQNPNFIGSRVEQGENDPERGEYGPNADIYDLIALTMTDHFPYDSNYPVGINPEDSASEWACRNAIKDGILWAVKHTTRAAPFDCGKAGDGYLEVSVYVDGVGVADWTGTCAKDEQVEVGDGITGAKYGIPVIEVDPDYTFSTAGRHAVDLTVLFVPDDTGLDQVKYTCRTEINVFELPEPSYNPSGASGPWYGSIYIVPGALIDDAGESVCPINGYTATLGWASMYLDALKGPFDTQADAEDCFEYFETVFQDYVNGCFCQIGNRPDGVGGTYEAADPATFTDVPVNDLIDAGGDSGTLFGSVAVSPFIVSNLSIVITTTAGSLTISSTDECTGKSFPTSGTFLVPACACPNLLATASGWTGSMVVGNDFYYVTQTEPCGLTLPEDWVYDTDLNTGVPNNSVELADYVESLE